MKIEYEFESKLAHRDLEKVAYVMMFVNIYSTLFCTKL